MEKQIIKKQKALVTAEVVREDLESSLGDRIEFTYAGYNLDHEVLPPQELCKKIKGFDILVCEYDTISKDVFKAADKLKLIICCRGGVKSVIDLEAAKKSKVVVCNNVGRNAGAVTDLVIAYILNLTRNITKTNNLIHDRKLVGAKSTKPKEYQDTVWGLDNNSPFIRFRGRSINHMTLGIVGYGHVGHILAQKANALGMEVIAYDPWFAAANAPNYVEGVTLPELLKTADVVSVHCALCDATRDMFNARRFKAMKKGAYFINTSRGEVVVEEDLVGALKSGKLAGAALDVTRQEPIPEDSQLVGCPNLLLTPHIAGSADDVQACGTHMVIESLRAYLEGAMPPHKVD